jgi:hypothetical protein
MNGKDKEGIAFGDAVRMSSPPNRSQIEVNPDESGFGGWADEKIKTAREAAPHLGWEKISYTTFDNISPLNFGNLFSLC